MSDDAEQVFAAHQVAFELAREAQAAGLVVTCMWPIRCGHGEDRTEFNISLWCADGTPWAEGGHESAEQIRTQHIAGYRRRMSG